MTYDQDRAARMQDATEAMIRMREPPEYKNEQVKSGQRIGELVQRVNVLSEQRDELLAALKLFIEELDDPSRRLPMCEYDSFAQTWKLNPHSHTVQLSLPLERIARAAIERAVGGGG